MDGNGVDQFAAFALMIGAIGIGLMVLGAAEKLIILASKRPSPPRPRVKSVSDAEMAEWKRCLAAVGHHDKEDV